LAIVNREIPAVLFEHELNFCTDRVIEHLDEDPEVAFKQFCDYLEIVNPQQSKYLSNLEEVCKHKDYFIKSIKENGFPIHQNPFFENIAFETLMNIYQSYDVIKPYNISHSSKPLIVADMYFLRLKHMNFNKFSARSLKNLSLKNVPIKSGIDYKNNKALYSTNPVRFGEQEILNLVLVQDTDALSNLVSAYSTNKHSRFDLAEKLLTQDDPFALVDIDNEGKSSVYKILETYLSCIGVEIK
jgi:hypothetical protein